MGIKIDNKRKEKRNAYCKKCRRDPKFLPGIIWRDTRSSDKKLLRENDLDKDFIKDKISNGCLYCGETKIRMTLDRIDNSLVHLKTNVNPACVRCNYLRRDMPYDAWLFLVEGIRKATEQGAFNGWLGGNTSKYTGGEDLMDFIEVGEGPEE
jgi:hypothetical protein